MIARGYVDFDYDNKLNPAQLLDQYTTPTLSRIEEVYGMQYTHCGRMTHNALYSAV